MDLSNIEEDVKKKDQLDNIIKETVDNIIKDVIESQKKCIYKYKKGKNKGKECGQKKLYKNSLFCKKNIIKIKFQKFVLLLWFHQKNNLKYHLMFLLF